MKMETVYMTRKIKYACEHGGMHHCLAAVAHEEAGITKKYLLTQGFRRTMRIEEDGVARGQGETWTELEFDEQSLWIKTFHADCVTKWRFSYPAMRLYSYSLERCSCGSTES